MWFIGNAIEPRLAEARLTYTSLAANKGNLTVATLDPLPEARHPLQFMLPPDKPCMLRSPFRLESALNRSLAFHPVDSHRCGNPLDLARLRIIVNENAAQEFERARSNIH